MRWFDRYKGLVRRVRLSYWLSNLINYSKLKKNKPLYKRFGLKRWVTSSISHKHFTKLSSSSSVSSEVNINSKYFGFPIEQLKQQFEEEGFVVIPGAFKKEADEINQEIDRLLNDGKLGFNFTGNKIVFANKESNYIRSFTENPELVGVLSALLEWNVSPFQTINFLYGSEQAAHSDSIHMSTHPEGKLTAAWIALEDVGPEQGPLYYLVGSHRLPYLYNEDLELIENSFLLDSNPNKKYEEKLKSVLEQHNFEEREFHPQKGDVLIWHPNLVHGGRPHINRSQTRKSMVIHYFGKDVICYHELTQRPAIL